MQQHSRHLEDQIEAFTLAPCVLSRCRVVERQRWSRSGKLSVVSLRADQVEWAMSVNLRKSLLLMQDSLSPAFRLTETCRTQGVKKSTICIVCLNIMRPNLLDRGSCHSMHRHFTDNFPKSLLMLALSLLASPPLLNHGQPHSRMSI